MNTVVNPVQQVDQAFYYILGISVVLLTLITLTMVVFVVKYRRSRHPEPADIRGNWKLEVVWTVIPTIIVLTMFSFGWSSYTGLRSVPAGALTVEVDAQMFTWLFYYPDGRESENELVVPLGKDVKLNITSVDVLHSLYIPSFRVKVDAVRGMTTYVWFYADKIGEYDIMCAEYCGVDHALMTGKVRVVTPEEYEAWLEEE